jgi:hypothetical protein
MNLCKSLIMTIQGNDDAVLGVVLNGFIVRSFQYK